MRYNIEVTIECRTIEDAQSVSSFIFFSGFMPFLEGTIITVVAKEIDQNALDYLSLAIEEDDRIISSSFHKTLF